MTLEQIQKNKLIAYINRYCQPWLAASENGKLELYRGVRQDPFKNKSDIYTVKNVRKKRRPLDNPSAVHKYFNKTIKKAGKVANRSNSIFVLGSLNSLKKNEETFGSFNFYMNVIPVGNFHYTWSTLFKDGYQYYEKTLSKYIYRDRTTGEINPPFKVEVPPELEEKIVSGWKGDDGSLDKAVRSRHEIMITSNKVLYIKPEAYKGLL